MAVVAAAAGPVGFDMPGPIIPVSRTETGLSGDDFETASIRSAAPSYFSDAPSYHSTMPSADPLPPYTPRAAAASGSSAPPNHSSAFSGGDGGGGGGGGGGGASAAAGGPQGLPPVSSGSTRSVPNLSHFQTRFQAWPSLDANPTTRLYHSVAQRRTSTTREYSYGSGYGRSGSRASAAGVDRHGGGGGGGGGGGPLERVMEQQEEEAGPGRGEFRPLEDPYLVGEQAAFLARRARLERERERERLATTLMHEDQRWDDFISQLRTIEVRERNIDRVRRVPEEAQAQRKSIFRRIILRRFS